jgi:hypothetical protein
VLVALAGLVAHEYFVSSSCRLTSWCELSRVDKAELLGRLHLLRTLRIGLIVCNQLSVLSISCHKARIGMFISLPKVKQARFILYKTQEHPSFEKFYQRGQQSQLAYLLEG